MTNRYQYQITSRLGTIEVAPLGESNFQIEWTRQDDARLEYKKALPSKILFRDEPLNPNNAYRHLLRLEKSSYRCEYITITVQRKCTQSGSIVWLPFFTGRLSLNDGDWDLSNCSVEVKLIDVKVEQCYEDNKAKEINVIQLSTKRTVKLQSAGITVETVSYSQTIQTNAGYCNQLYWGGIGTPSDGGWVYYYLEYYTNTMYSECYMRADWAREVITIDCNAPSPGSEWILVQDTCPSGGRKYARPARTTNCSYQFPDPDDQTQHEYYTCNVLGLSGVAQSIDNGVRLDEVLNLFIENFCPNYTLVSNFFQINPDVISDIDYVTGLKSTKHNIVVFQKSDVKRPNLSNNATRGIWTFEKVLNALTKACNMKWDMENNILRLEHVSFFAKNQGFDLNDSRFAQYIKAKYQYSYDTGNIPSQEVFKWMEAKEGDFAGFPIVYSGACVSAGSEQKTYVIEDVTTDVELCLNNPDSDSQAVSDNGFVLMACEIYNGDYYLITESPIFGGSTLNNTLSWAHLHRDYYRYNRPLRRGNLNQADTIFFTVQPTKKGAQISIPLCCDDTFNPNDQITGLFGQAIVDKATFSFIDNMLKLDLLYDAEYNLFNNQAPVANNDVADTFVDTSIIIPVLDNDSDPDGVITSIQLTYGPLHGTAVINSLNQIVYTPASSYIGDDYISYVVLDDYKQASNQALIAIDVLPANTGPVAMDDTYYADKNTTRTIAAPGLFANDTDDQGFTLQSYDAISTQGGTVTVNADGSFSFVPATNFVGSDSFNYTIVDGAGLTGTATVTVNVRDPNNPIAQDDIYSTKINTNLMIAAPGVLGNDTTGVGTLSAIAVSGTTSHGGTYMLNTDGSFVYNPATDYTGTDNFAYTASNGIGSESAMVIINILPQIYVRLNKINDSITYLQQDCSGMASSAGESHSATFRASFFSNSAGTTPFDVSGLGLRLNYSVTGYDYAGNPFSDPSYVDVPGMTYYDVFTGVYYRNQYDCNGNAISPLYVNEDYVLTAGNYTILS